MQNGYDATTETEAVSASEYGELFLQLTRWYKKDLPRVLEWRKEAKEDFQFVAGDQWSEEDKASLREKNRVPVVFNRIAPLVRAVVGSEINNRREVQYIPREIGDAKANELLTAAGEWFRDQTGAEDEESDAFEDTVIAGMGWTDTRLDFEDDPDGSPVVERMDCMEMVWDCNVQKPNLQGAERMFRVKEFTYADAKEMFPKVEPSELNAEWARSGSVGSPHNQDRADDYDGTQTDYGSDENRGNCLIVECRWLEREKYWRGPDMQTGEVREYSDAQMKLIRKNLPDFPGVQQSRKIVRRAFLGKTVLGKPDKPMTPPGMFGWECITGYRDKDKQQFYGVVRPAKDPQRWTNKFFSQVMYLLNSQSKGGIAAERDAFENPRQAEASWAKADEITWMNKGSLSGQAPKIKDKPAAQFPAGFFTLFQESKEEITQVTGLSPEFIGTREVDQAGVLEMQRRQSSLNLLASLFNSLRRYRKSQGRVMLYLIQNLPGEGRLIRIVGDEKKQYVPLTKESVANITYDIIVDDAPTSPNEKDRTWGIIMQLVPAVKEMLTPDIMLELLRYSPLPASMVDKLTQQVKQAKEEAGQKPSPEEQKMQSEQQSQQIDMAGKVSDLQAKRESNQMDAQMKALDLFIEQQSAQNKLQVENQKLGLAQQKLELQAASNAISRQNADARQTSAAS